MQQNIPPLADGLLQVREFTCLQGFLNFGSGWLDCLQPASISKNAKLIARMIYLCFIVYLTFFARFMPRIHLNTSQINTMTTA